MATISVASDKISKAAVYDSTSHKWLALGNADDGEPVQLPGHSDRSVQVFGTFGAATCVLEGSNDGTNWVTLTDTAGSALSFTTAGLRQVLQVTRFIRPKTSGGTGTSLNVYLLSVRK